MQVPKRDPQAQEKADRRSQLAAVMEQAVNHFRLQLKTAAAAEARDYLARRGMSEATQERFDIGFAPDTRQGLFQHLTGKGVAPDLIIDAGLCAKPDDGGAPFDRFRGRIIFPIRDPRGRAIALGGRAMDPNARAKYLNSPETALFDKGRSLYNHGPAREAAGKGQPLIVAEGYMDVIALSEAGFGATVAPLGTAITEDQLQLLWRISPEPVIALDGDTAGLRAAMRLIDLALPMLEAGKSLRFALMPEGQDPDDLIKARGRGAMQKLIDAAQPMVSLLWQRETDGKVFDSPERKAALDKSLRESIKRIPDPSVRNHYGEEIKRLRWDLFRQAGDRRQNWRKQRQAPIAPLPGTKASALASGARIEERLREAVILATLILHPTIIDRFESALERMEIQSDDHRRLRDAILRHLDVPDSDFRQAIETDIGSQPLENLFATGHVMLAPTIRSPGNDEIAATCVAEELAKLETQRGIRREIDDAVQDLSELADEGLTWRLSQAAEARNRAERCETEDTIAYDYGDNGAPMDRAERERLDALLSGISFSKIRKGRG